MRRIAATNKDEVFAVAPSLFLPTGEPRPDLLRCHPRAYLGVDLGQARDHAALVLLQRLELLLPKRDYITWEYREATLIVARFAERFPLGMSYPAVAAHIASLAAKPPLADRGQIVVDATGVGAPVVDLLRSEPGLRCPVVPVVITPGEFESETNGRWHVPKRDLMDGLRIAFESRRLCMATGIPQPLLDELEHLRARRTAKGSRKAGSTGRNHDDMALALALAWWRASREAGRTG